MKRYYEFNLLQVGEEQGYINPGIKIEKYDRSTIDLLYRGNLSDYSFGKIIVEKTLNPFVVREIVTGLEIPFLHCKRAECYVVYSSGRSGYEESVKKAFPLGNVHTFVRSLTHYISGPIVGESQNEIGYKEITSKAEIDKYKSEHSDVDKYRKELRAYGFEGRKKMNNKLAEELELRRGVSSEEAIRINDLKQQTKERRRSLSVNKIF